MQVLLQPILPEQRNKIRTLFLQRATERTRTVDLLITNQLLYQLSYSGLDFGKNLSIISFPELVKITLETYAAARFC
jgi:hypothetical protein